LDRAMVQAAWSGAEDADLILLVIDAAAKLGERVEAMLANIEGRPEPVVIVLNKVDIAKKDDLLAYASRLSERLNPRAIFMISATSGDGVADLKQALADAMPQGPWHFPEDQVSDATDRMLAAEVTREQLYLQLHAELPYASAVETEKYEERRDGSVAIHQQILVGRDTQKAIVLGKGGARLKQIGTAAREELERALSGVHLDEPADEDDDRAPGRQIFDVLAEDADASRVIDAPSVFEERSVYCPPPPREGASETTLVIGAADGEAVPVGIGDEELRLVVVAHQRQATLQREARLGVRQLRAEVVALDAIGVVQEVQRVVDDQPEARPPADETLLDVRRQADLAQLLEHPAVDGEKPHQRRTRPPTEHHLERALQREDVGVEARARRHLCEQVLDVVELSRIGKGGRQVVQLLPEEEPLFVIEHRLPYGYRPRSVVASATRATATM
ncbi:MAG: GTPase Era, partial [Chloroflexi bacterium]|nr:GTPase Era [Chloroflexota bacterium]